MVKKKSYHFKSLVTFIAPTIFFLSLLFLVVVVFLLGVRSLSDISDLKYLIIGTVGLMFVSILAIKTTGLEIKKVLVGWLENNLHWLFP